MSSRPSSKRRSLRATPRQELRLVHVFSRVRAFVARRLPALAGVTFRGCPGVRGGMRGLARLRAYAHVGHVRRMICLADEAAALPAAFLAGILLHEFGHLAGNPNDQDADRWVFETFGIVIEYKSAFALEWVGKAALAAMGLAR